MAPHGGSPWWLLRVAPQAGSSHFLSELFDLTGITEPYVKHDLLPPPWGEGAIYPVRSSVSDGGALRPPPPSSRNF